MQLETTQRCAICFLTINNNRNMADARSCEMGAKVTPLNIVK
jgi:hypothetical protein